MRERVPMKAKMTSRKFILTVMGLVAMIWEPTIAVHVVTLIGITVAGFSAIDYKLASGTPENKEGK